jgi:hypothetical protein
VAELGWKEGQGLTVKVDGAKLIIDLEKVK